MKSYHSTIPERVASIMRYGLQPNSEPLWFNTPVPYVLLSKEPWRGLNGEETIVLEVSDPDIKEEYFDELEGLRWPHAIALQYVKVTELTRKE